MAITRINKPNDATWSKAWSVADATERATLLATAGFALGIARGDWIFQIDTSQWYIFAGGTTLLAIIDGSDVARLSAANVFTNTPQRISAADPEFNLFNTSVAANSRLMGWQNSAGLLLIFKANDDGSGGTALITIARSNGNLNLLGNIESFAGQIGFPSTQNPSSNANTLDDYEEGTWTPTDASGAGLSFGTTFTAQYVKAGQLVFVNLAITYPATASGASAKIGGLPFTVSSSQGGLTAGYSAAGGYREWLVIQSSTEIWPFNAATGGQYTNSNLTGADVRLSGCYRAAA